MLNNILINLSKKVVFLSGISGAIAASRRNHRVMCIVKLHTIYYRFFISNSHIYVYVYLYKNIKEN